MTTCSISDCQRPALKRGRCNAHYLRWYRHGDPEHGEMMRGTARDWLLHHVNHDGDDCLIWPFARGSHGYGLINFKGFEGTQAHRVMCILVHGEPPSPSHHAAHNCGNGGDGCVNPRHLRWKTPQQNVDDKKEHGTQPWGEQIEHFVKLTEEQARRAKYGGERGVALAREFGVKPMTIYNIRAGRTWKGLNR